MYDTSTFQWEGATLTRSLTRKRTDVSPPVFYHVALKHSTPFFLSFPTFPTSSLRVYRRLICLRRPGGLFPQPDPTLPYPVIHPLLLACGHGAGLVFTYQELCRAGGAMFHERYKCVSTRTVFAQYQHTNDGRRWVCYRMGRRWCVSP